MNLDCHFKYCYLLGDSHHHKYDPHSQTVFLFSCCRMEGIIDNIMKCLYGNSFLTGLPLGIRFFNTACFYQLTH